MNTQQLVRVTDQPRYARVMCEKCGSLMNSLASDAKWFFVGESPPTVLSAGALPVERAKRGLLATAFGKRAVATISDPDIDLYPQIADVRRDPQVLRSDLYSYLQTSDLFLVRNGDVPATAMVCRCPSHHLSVPLTDRLPIGIQVEVHEVGREEIFAVYALVWDNAKSPWFVENSECPYSMVGANDEEMGKPVVHGYQWRKLFYLLVQDETEILFLDEKDQLVCSRIARLRPGQAEKFDALLNRLEACSGRHISKPDLIGLHLLHNQTVDIREVQARFPGL